MRHFTETVYNFDELTPEVQAKVLDHFRETEDFPFLSEDMRYCALELLANNGISVDGDIKVYYDLGYSQGDGAMFEGDFDWKHYHAWVRQSGRYSHYNSKTIEMQTAKGNDVTAKVATEFNELYIDICRQLERYGYDIMENALTDVNLTDMIEANEYEFYADGRLV